MSLWRSGLYDKIDASEGGLTQFWELFTVITCVPKNVNLYLKASRSQIRCEVSLKVEEAKSWILGHVHTIPNHLSEHPENNIG